MNGQSKRGIQLRSGCCPTVTAKAGHAGAHDGGEIAAGIKSMHGMVGRADINIV